jgi:colanic acid biosynthesis glycosyl transferase WcaI
MDQPRKNILLITSNFSPEESGIAVYSSDITYHALKETSEVTVLTTLPHYPWWGIPKKFEHISPGRSKIDGVEIFRFSPFIPKKSSALGRARFEFSFWRHGKKTLKKMDLRKFDLVVAIMPTVSSGLLARKVYRKLRIPGIVIFQDISSLGALQSGIPGGKLLYRIAKHLEIWASKWASRIVVVSEAMIPVVSQFIKLSNRIELIHNYSVLSQVEMNRAEARAFLNLDENAFLLLHSGNMGHKQDLMNIVEAARIIEEHSDIKFMLVGHGNQENIIRRAIEGCQNIEWRTFFSAEDFPKALASADVLLVNEIPTLREMALPSKLTSYLASGTPVIAAVSSDSATSNFLGDAAYVVAAGNPKALADAILKLKCDVTLREKLGNKAKIFSGEYLSASAGRRKYVKLVESIRIQG